MLLFASLCIWGGRASCQAAELLVADRLTDSVYRYSESGELLGTLIDGHVDNNLNQPVGLAISPDRTKLFVSSFQGGVTRYDYSYATHTATNPIAFAGAADGLSAPNALLFSQDGSTLYVSNLGGTGVSRFNLDGSSAGPPLMGPGGNGSQSPYTGLAYNPQGKLLVGLFQDNTGTKGGVAIADTTTGMLSDFVANTPAISGASGVMVHGNQLYVTGMFAGTIRRFDATTGAADPIFAVDGLGFPQALLPAGDLNGFLAGILGVANGAGRIERYDYSGNDLGTFASPSSAGFTEATAFVTTIPQPTRGDFNLDGEVSSADIPFMLQALTDLDTYKAAENISQADLLTIGDFDNSNSVTNADIQGLLHALESAGGGGGAAVPEPDGATIMVIGFAASAGLLRRRCRFRAFNCYT
jgi:sugar lactone lactonase YvrE